MVWSPRTHVMSLSYKIVNFSFILQYCLEIVPRPEPAVIPSIHVIFGWITRNNCYDEKLHENFLPSFTLGVQT